MSIHTQELHPALAHFPLVLLPAALIVDAVGYSRNDRALMSVGRRLMPFAAGSAVLAAAAGFVAQGSARTDARSQAMLETHRNLNVGLTLVSLVLAKVRAERRQPGLPYLLTGFAGLAVAGYTAYLGGRMVYGHGVGVEAADGVDPGRAPELGSGRFRKALVRNAKEAMRSMVADLREGRYLPALRRLPRRLNPDRHQAPAA